MVSNLVWVQKILEDLKNHVDKHPDRVLFEYYSEIAKRFSAGAEQIRILVVKKPGYTSKKINNLYRTR